MSGGITIIVISAFTCEYSEIKEVTEMDRRVIGVFGYIWALLLILTLWFLSRNEMYGGMTIYFLIIYLLATFFLIYFVFIPQNLFFTMVGEGSAKFIDSGGEVIATLLQSVGEDIEYQPDGDIISSPKKKWNLGWSGPWNLRGGLWFYGLWPIRDVHIYEHEWTNIDEHGEIDFHPKRWIDYIMVKLDTYYQKMPMVESADLVPLIVELIIRARPKNPFKARFKVRGWLSSTFDTTLPEVRDALGRIEYKPLQNRGSLKEELGRGVYDKMKNEGDFDVLKNDMGVDVQNIGVKDINPDPKYRDDTLKEWEAKKDAEAAAVKADIEAKIAVVKADGEARATIIKARAEAGAILIKNKAVQEYGDLGRFLEAVKAAESPGALSDVLKVYLLPDVADALKKKELSKDELKIIIEEIISEKTKK